MGKFKFRDRMEQFMRGRYGTDQLNNAMLVFCLILMIAEIFVKSMLFGVFTWIVLVLMIFRTFSRNYHKRRMENDKFLWIWNKIKAELFLTIRRIKEMKAYRFRKCPRCKAVLRLPRKVGRHTAVCPCCHNEFKTRVLL
jgi:hypothetical protein